MRARYCLGACMCYVTLLPGPCSAGITAPTCTAGFGLASSFDRHHPAQQLTCRRPSSSSFSSCSSATLPCKPSTCSHEAGVGPQQGKRGPQHCLPYTTRGPHSAVQGCCLQWNAMLLSAQSALPCRPGRAFTHLGPEGVQLALVSLLIPLPLLLLNTQRQAQRLMLRMGAAGTREGGHITVTASAC